MTEEALIIGLLTGTSTDRQTSTPLSMSERLAHARIRDFSRDLISIAEHIIRMLAHALDMTEPRSVDSLERFKRSDHEITMKEIELEERCLTFLAIEHPAAIDLRTIVTIIKAKNDLERINDLALHIMERVHEITPEMYESFDFGEIGRRTITMAEKSIEAFISVDPTIADEVYALDEEIHAMLQKVFKTAKALMNNTMIDSDQLLAALSISRHIGLINEHVGSIARTVHYLANGEIIPCRESFYRKLAESLNLSDN
jgi:phosphate transport system protein